MTRLYASITLAALAMMAAPRVDRAIVASVRAVDRYADQMARVAADRWMRGETVGDIAVDVVGCIVTETAEEAR